MTPDDLTVAIPAGAVVAVAVSVMAWAAREWWAGNKAAKADAGAELARVKAEREAEARAEAQRKADRADETLATLARSLTSLNTEFGKFCTDVNSKIDKVADDVRHGFEAMALQREADKLAAQTRLDGHDREHAQHRESIGRIGGRVGDTEKSIAILSDRQDRRKES